MPGVYHLLLRCYNIIVSIIIIIVVVIIIIIIIIQLSPSRTGFGVPDRQAGRPEGRRAFRTEQFERCAGCPAKGGSQAHRRAGENSCVQADRH